MPNHFPRLGFRRAGAVLATAALSLAGLAGTVPTARAEGASFCADGSQPMAGVAEVEAYPAGTAVTGSSVVQGTTPSPFTGRYIGYIDDALGKGKDLLLFQLSSPVIDGTAGLKPAGIWAGMSGSPVYASNGSLIGAVSYSLNADNLPVAGVTPAEYMKAIGGTLATPPAAIRVNEGNLENAKGLRATSAAAKALDVGSTLRQVGLSNVSTASAQGAKLTNALLARVPAGSSPAASRLRSKAFNAVAADDADAPLVAGGNIAVFYNSGDSLTGAVGTVTAICGNEVWAFGHPMDFAGTTTLGMSNASAAMIVPDATGIVGSYKQVRSIGVPLGMITQDRMAGIKGSVGQVSGYRITLTVRNAATTPVDRRSSTVILPEAGPDAAASLVGNAVIEDLDNYYTGTVRLNWAISYRTADGQTGTLQKQQTYAATDVVASYPATDVQDDLYALIFNDFADVEITDVTMNLTLLDEHAVVYHPSGVQYKKGQTWVTLKSKTLKPGGSYSVRPVYLASVNGKHSGPSVFGTAHTMTLSKKAVRKGSMSYAATVEQSDCDDDFSCDELDEVDASGFDDLIDELSRVDSNDQVTRTLRYSRKSGGGASVVAFVTGPGVVEGSVKVSFKIS